MPNFRKIEITIDFNENLVDLCGVITHWLMNIAETFTDIFKHVLPANECYQQKKRSSK